MKRTKLLISGFVIIFAAGLLSLSFIPQETVKPETQKDQVGNKEVVIGKLVSKAQLAAYKNVYVALGEDFAFDGVKFEVLSYMLLVVPKHGNTLIIPVSGSKISPEARQALLGVKSGDLVMLSQVKVKGPSGKMILDGPVLRVK